jgi:hypothetical protein
MIIGQVHYNYWCMVLSFQLKCESLQVVHKVEMIRPNLCG